jgi:uncharacterized protein YprB with RNaseH-like and TPR domain
MEPGTRQDDAPEGQALGDKSQSEGGDGFHREDRLRSDMREISRKLSRLRRSDPNVSRPEAAPVCPPQEPAPQVLRIEDLRRRARSKGAQTPPAPAVTTAGPTAPAHLEENTAGTELPTALGTAAYVIQTAVSGRGSGAAGVVESLATAMADEGRALGAHLGRLIGGHRATLEDLLFLDLETTGLQSTPLFLIGAMTWEDGDLVVRQFFARHYGEEAAVISAFLQRATSRRVLVSFNGKSYDWPYVRMRAAATGVRFELDPAHLDLLHESRRIWRGAVPDCRLQTLEQYVLGHQPREDDIPGRDIPDAYHRFVRTGDATEMLSVLEHNLLDLVSLAELLVRALG